MFVNQPLVSFCEYVRGVEIFTVDVCLPRNFGLPRYQFTDIDTWTHEFTEHAIASFLKEEGKIWYMFNMTVPHLMSSLVTDSGYIRADESVVRELTPDEFWAELKGYIQRMKEDGKMAWRWKHE